MARSWPGRQREQEGKAPKACRGRSIPGMQWATGKGEGEGPEKEWAWSPGLLGQPPEFAPHSESVGMLGVHHDEPIPLQQAQLSERWFLHL